MSAGSYRAPFLKSEEVAVAFGWIPPSKPPLGDELIFAPIAPILDLKDPLAPPNPVPKDTTPAPKPRWEFLDFRAISLAAEVMALNEQKHGHLNAGAEYSDGWKKLPRAKHFGSLMRHLSSYWAFTVTGGKFGEYYDPETGKPHLAHAMCRIMFLLGIELDANT